jgi:hypothetical protein
VSDVRAAFRNVLLASMALAIAFAPAIVLNKLNGSNAHRAGSAQAEVSGSHHSQGN